MSSLKTSGKINFLSSFRIEQQLFCKSESLPYLAKRSLTGTVVPLRLNDEMGLIGTNCQGTSVRGQHGWVQKRSKLSTGGERRQNSIVDRWEMHGVRATEPPTLPLSPSLPDRILQTDKLSLSTTAGKDVQSVTYSPASSQADTSLPGTQPPPCPQQQVSVLPKQS